LTDVHTTLVKSMVSGTLIGTYQPLALCGNEKIWCLILINDRLINNTLMFIIKFVIQLISEKQ
jgi:hypothetical protein